MIKFLPPSHHHPFLFFFKIVSHKHHIFIKHYIENVYHNDQNISHYCSTAVHMSRHQNGLIPVILKTICKNNI